MEQSELSSIATLASVQPSNCPVTGGAYSVRSLYIPQHGYSGTLYRNNEHVLITSNEDHETIVLQISKIFVLYIDEAYRIFVTGSKYSSVGTHLPSGNVIVQKTDLLETNTGQDIIRKVMLYQDDQQADYFIVVDYERSDLPLLPEDILVPQFLEPGDMVSVNGGNEETWLAHVQSTNPLSKWCQVYFYMPDKDSPGLYKRERHRLERVYWDSILSLVPGRWLSETQYSIYIHN